MIDIFAIGLTHGLILLACWRLMWREELDEPAELRGDDPPRDSAADPARGSGR